MSKSCTFIRKMIINRLVPFSKIFSGLTLRSLGIQALLKSFGLVSFTNAKPLGVFFQYFPSICFSWEYDMHQNLTHEFWTSPCPWSPQSRYHQTEQMRSREWERDQPCICRIRRCHMWVQWTESFALFWWRMVMQTHFVWWALDEDDSPLFPTSGVLNLRCYFPAFLMIFFLFGSNEL